MQALTTVPEMLWYILASVIAFWFSGRILEKAPMKIKQQEIDSAKVIAKEVNEARQTLKSEKDWEDKYQEELKDNSKPLSNRAILEWNQRRKNNP
jgi:DNA-binding transcriptional regulator GbsR (MarR family)